MSAQFPVHIQKSNSSDFKGHKATICSYSTYLKERGHRDGTLHAYCSALTHFLRWLTTESPQRQLINIVTVDAFLNEHLPVCNCLPPVYKEHKTVRAALNQLLLLQGESRVKTFVAETTSAVEVTLHEFDIFLRDVCGLSISTRFYRHRFVGSFLDWLSDTSRLDLAKITSGDLVRFVTDQARHLKPSSIGVLLTSLRSYFRFLQFKGESNISLFAAVPKPPNWSLASLPPCLSDEEIGRFFTTFDLLTPIGKRDYGMARCLMDLGLRCHEVAALQLEDINWYHGIVELHSSKNRQIGQLPLPERTGRAIVDYLRDGRPATPSRSIFVLHRAPLGRGVANTTVRGAIRRAFSRANLPWTGTHILRHTMATKLIQSGVPLKEIADVLRHRNIDTTQIYTKVNLPELAQVAIPWPGRSQ